MTEVREYAYGRIVEMPEDAQKALRAAFPADQVGKLPRGGEGQKERCRVCNGWHKRGAVHLDYVGHAALTDRLLQVDPDWTWEPVAWAPDGAPMIRVDGSRASLWIRLTIAGVTRLGVGTAEATKFDVEKELIGDALRNAGMRFGVALDLWAKEPLHGGDDEGDRRTEPPGGGTTPPPDSRAQDAEAQARGFDSQEDYSKCLGFFDASVRKAKDDGLLDEGQQELLRAGYGRGVRPLTRAKLAEGTATLARLVSGGKGAEPFGHPNQARDDIREASGDVVEGKPDPKADTTPENLTGAGAQPEPETGKQGYDNWPMEDLTNELKHRNVQGRNPPLKKGGSRADRIKRLREDDPDGYVEPNERPF